MKNSVCPGEDSGVSFCGGYLYRGRGKVGECGDFEFLFYIEGTVFTPVGNVEMFSCRGFFCVG